MPKVINLPQDIISDRIIEGIVPTDEEKHELAIYQSSVLGMLSCIADLLTRSLNHHRQITNIESDEGEEY